MFPLLTQGREQKASTALYLTVFVTFFGFVNTAMIYATSESSRELCARLSFICTVPPTPPDLVHYADAATPTMMPTMAP